MEVPKRYDPKESEPKWQKFWEDKDIFKFDPDSKKEIFSIDTPPPTVSGAMHLGHAFSYSQTDFVARYRRMKGFNVFYPFGTDDNGLPTALLIEKTKGVKAKKMDREAFIKLCLETLEEIRPGFVQDWKNIGISCDFSIFYSTIDDHSRRIAQRSFVELYEKGKIYRKHAPIIFCPKCKTAIAQVEMEDEEKNTTLNYIKAEMEGGDKIVYATTRPELLPGCIGLSLHEGGTYVKVKVGDEHWLVSKSCVDRMKEEFNFGEIEGEFRGADLIGKKVTIPLTNKVVQISHDEITNTEFGTGFVYYCSYGGMDCIEWLTRHPGVEPIHVMGLDGVYNGLCGKYEGMNSTEARKDILEDLDAAGVLVLKENMRHAVNTHERCGTDIEYVALEQWFINVLDMKDTLLQRGQEMTWYPPHMRVRYDTWTNGLKWDWCISRQRHFGVPFPLWYCTKCDEPITANTEDLPVDPIKDKPNKTCKCGSKDFRPEKDVLDTWATSSHTPELATELLKDKPVFQKLQPMTLRPQAHDIITFWLFNTVVKSELHHGRIPWTSLAISGFALDPKGKKMSKSKGNAIAPQAMVEKYSSDALRFWAAGSKLGDDMPFQEKDLVTGGKTINKLWNATKFAFMQLEDFDPKEDPELLEVDTWLLHKLHQIVKTSTEAFDKYEYSKTKQETDTFFWKTFCDNYLEIIKDRVYNPDTRGELGKKSAQYALYHGLYTVLRLFAPIMPYITEEIYQNFYKKFEGHESIHLAPWPSAEKAYLEFEHPQIGETLLYAVEAARRAKSEKNVSLKTPIKKFTIRSKLNEAQFDMIKDDLKAATKAEDLHYEPLSKDSKLEYEHDILLE